MSEPNHRLLIRKLADGLELTREEAQYLAEQILLGKLDPVEVASILTALKVRGERAQEVAGFAYVLRQHCIKVSLSDELRCKVIDTAGTGGDSSHTVNVSTASAIVAACCGAYVLKHGNRAMSSKSGSADFMEALGYNIYLEPDQVVKLLEQTRFAFVFAQKYHPLLREVAPIRRKLGFRTIFNLVGPLSNPGLVMRQVLGVARPELAALMIEAMRELGYIRALVIYGEPGLDEVSISGRTYIYELRGGQIEKYMIEPEDLGLKRADLTELQVSDPRESVEKILRALTPGQRGPVRDFILANTAAALYCADIVKNLRDGVELAQKLIEDGVVLDYINRIVELSKKIR